MKNIHIFGGGTISHISNHFAVSAPAYGNTAKELYELLYVWPNKNMDVDLHLTKMAGGRVMETNWDIALKIEELKKDNNTKIIFFSCALVDFEPVYLNSYKEFRKDISGVESLLSYPPIFETKNFGKYVGRLETNKTDILEIGFIPTLKIIKNIRKGRKDIFLVGFKTTCGASKQEMFEKGLNLCKESSVNLVLVNDTKTRWNMIVTPEEAVYHETDNREDVLKNLVEMTLLRSHLTFTQSTVIDGKPVDWNDKRVPDSLRKVVNYCINGNAYKPFNGSTVGHFAVKLSNTEFLTSIRRSNFNDLDKIGLVYVKTDGPDTVIAYGAKPSVGGQSQRIVFKNHEGFDCIVHFHSPLKNNHCDNIPVRSQREVECGSHECGENTSDGLKQFGNLKCVFLDNHGPNIVFNRDINPNEVIDFINKNFELTEKTGGYNLK